MKSWLVLTFALLVLGGPAMVVLRSNDATSSADKLATHWRRPVAVVVSPDGRRAYVANRRSGTISIVDLTTEKTIGEVAVGKQLSDLESDRTGKRLVALDDAAHEMIVLQVDPAAKEELQVSQRLPVAPYPVRIIFAADGLQAFVSSLWSHQLSIVQWKDESSLAEVAHVIDLPFAPRELLLIPEKERLIVADNFGGHLGIVYPPLAKLLLVQTLPAHQIRGLRLTADRQKLIVIHQMLNEKAQSIQSDVHWGLLMSNDLRWLKLETVLYQVPPGEEGTTALYRGGHVHPLGEPGRGGADPSAVDVAADGTVIVSLAGTGDIAVGKEEDFSFYKIRSGRGSAEYGDEYYSADDAKKLGSHRPVDIQFAPDGRKAYAADMFGESLTVVNVGEREIVKQIKLGPTPAEMSLVERGEVIFHDAHRAHDGWMSCHSCHVDGHTNGYLNDNQSDGGFGASKRVLSLLGQADTAPYAWTGEIDDLKDQMHNSLVKTMQGKQEPSDKDVASLAAYVQSLQLPPPVDVLRQRAADAAQIERGKAIFVSRDCARCHAPPTYTSPEVYDVGLSDELGNTKFNPPSLRGLTHRGPYLHDNRATTLEQIFTTQAHPDGEALSAEQAKDLAAFLKTL